MKFDFRQLEKDIRSYFYREMYKNRYEGIVNMELQNSFMQTKTGQEKVGAERALEIVEKNKKSIKETKAELLLIKSFIE